MEDQVRAAVERYVAGVSTNDAELVKQAFTEDGRMWGYLGDDFTVMTAVDFAEQVVATAPPADPAYRAEIHGIEVTGGIATAILDERAYLGSDFRNQFGLVRVDGVWRIASKVFTTR